jgi:hypothetical protein
VAGAPPPAALPPPRERRHTALFDRLLQELLSRSDITVFTQEKVDGLSCLIDTTVEVDPVAFALAIRFVDTPRVPTGRLNRRHCFTKWGTYRCTQHIMVV